jgi:hypothetical protein
VIELSPLGAQDHAFGAVSGRWAEGRLGDMEKTQHEVRVSDDAETPQTEESRTQQATAVTVARMLANPRRIRRS